MLCAKGAAILQSKSINVEDAANELINMLCTTKDEPEEEEDDEDDEDESSKPEQEQQEQEGNDCFLVVYQKTISDLAKCFTRLKYLRSVSKAIIQINASDKT